MCKLTRFLEEKIKYFTEQHGVLKLTKRIEPRKRSVSYTQLKEEYLMSKKINNNFIALEDNMFAAFVKESPYKIPKNQKISIKRKAKVGGKDIAKIEPSDGLVYTTRGSFVSNGGYGMNQSEFYILATEKIPILFICKYFVQDQPFFTNIPTKKLHPFYQR